MPGILSAPPDSTAPVVLPSRQLDHGLPFGLAERLGLLVALLHVGAAIYLVGNLHLTTPEALQRTAHLGVLFDGVDPNLEAFGLERPPLLSLLAAPFALIDGLRDHGLAVALASAMTGWLTVPVALPLARWAGLGTWATRLFVAAIAFHPLLWYSGAVGLPETLYSLLLLAAFGQVARWIDTETTGSVISAGVLLGIVFLVRYNALLIGVVVTAVVFWVGNARSPLTERPDRAQAWSAAMLVPVVFTMGLWVLATWLLTGDNTGFLGAAADLSALGAEQGPVLDRMDDYSGDILATGGWVLGWALLIGTPSLIGIGALLAHGVLTRRPESVGLGLVLLATLLPEFVSLLTGHGQAHVPHLFAFAFPAFIAFAYWERREAHGERPGSYDDRRRRRQIVIGAALLASSLGTVAVLPLMPDADAPAPALVSALRDREAVPPDPTVERVARWVDANAGAGDVLADIDRHAEVMLAAQSIDRFRTAADDGDDAVLFDPFGIANFVLVRATQPRQANGWIERAHPGLFEDGRPFMTLERDFGEYRIYRVDSAAFR